MTLTTTTTNAALSAYDAEISLAVCLPAGARRDAAVKAAVFALADAVGDDAWSVAGCNQDGGCPLEWYKEWFGMAS